MSLDTFLKEAEALEKKRRLGPNAKYDVKFVFPDNMPVERRESFVDHCQFTANNFAKVCEALRVAREALKECLDNMESDFGQSVLKEAFPKGVDALTKIQAIFSEENK